MDKSSVVNQFTNYVDQLRTQECSQKEKINCFQHIAECILSPAMVSHINYATHCSNATSVLLLFCEDLDSVVRMSAEENLNRIFRSLEKTRVKRILMDLYGEIKKNGNQRSLRICLNLFAYYTPHIKEKYITSYAFRLLPCLQTIAQRKETQLCETLCEFIKCFAKNMLVGLNYLQTCKLIDVFIANFGSECAVKRRCSSQNCISLIENSRNRSLMAKHALNKAIDSLLNSDHQNTNNVLLGTLGFLRILLPLIIRAESKDTNHIYHKKSTTTTNNSNNNNKTDDNNCNSNSNSNSSLQDAKQIVEIYDFCLHLLNTNHTSSHSIINASLEVINSILQSFDGGGGGNSGSGTNTSAAGKTLEHLLCNHQLHHNEYLRKRKSLKNQIFQLKNFQMTCNVSGNGTGGASVGGSGMSEVTRGTISTSASPFKSVSMKKKSTQEEKSWIPPGHELLSSPQAHSRATTTTDRTSQSLLVGGGAADGDEDASELNKHGTSSLKKSTMTTPPPPTTMSVTERSTLKVKSTTTASAVEEEESIRDAFKLGMEKMSSSMSTSSSLMGTPTHPTPPPRRHHQQQQQQQPRTASGLVSDSKCDDKMRHGNGNSKVNIKTKRSCSSNSGISVDDDDEACTVSQTSTRANDELQLKNHKDDQHHRRNIDDDNDDDDDDDDDGFTTLLEVNEPLQKDPHLLLSSESSLLSLSMGEPPSSKLRGKVMLPKASETEEEESEQQLMVAPPTVTVNVDLLIEGEGDGEEGFGGGGGGGSSDDKSQFLSDIDNESFNSIDFESEITIGGGGGGIGSGNSGEHDNNNSDNKDSESTTTTTSRVIPPLTAGGASSTSSLQRRATTTSMSLNSSGNDSSGGGGGVKSSDTIGSFFNNLLSHSSAESMTKLFRSTPKPTTLPILADTSPLPAAINSQQQQKLQQQQQKEQQQQQDADNLSLESINSHISLSSHVSLPTNSSSSRNEQDLVMVLPHHNAAATGGNGNPNTSTTTSAGAGVNDDALSSASATASTALLMDNTNTRNSTDDEDESSSVTKSQLLDEFDNPTDPSQLQQQHHSMQLNIGTIYEQAIIYYTTRSIALKFLLTGQRGYLQSDSSVRVSIKHLSLNVIANCARLMPEVMQIPLEISFAEIKRTQLALQIPEEEDEQLALVAEGHHSSNHSSDTSSSSNVGKDFDHLTDDCSRLGGGVVGGDFTPLGVLSAGDLIPLEIKDDHFGESTTNDFLNQPLSKSADPLLLFAELGGPLAASSHEKSPKPKRNHKRSEQILSKSEIIESKTSRSSYVKGRTPLVSVVDAAQPITSQLRDTSIGKSAAEKFNLVSKPKSASTETYSTKSPTHDISIGGGGSGSGRTIYDIQHHHMLLRAEGHQQILSDVLLFYNHSDPILRGDVQIIIGNFTQSTLGLYHNCNELFDIDSGGDGHNVNENNDDDGDGDGKSDGKVGGNWEPNCLHHSPLHINRLLAILIKGLQDDIHTVVIHALNALDKIFPLLMSKYLTASFIQKMPAFNSKSCSSPTKSHQHSPDETYDIGVSNGSDYHNQNQNQNRLNQNLDDHLLYADDDTLIGNLLKCFEVDHNQSNGKSGVAATNNDYDNDEKVNCSGSPIRRNSASASADQDQNQDHQHQSHQQPRIRRERQVADGDFFIISPKLLLSKLRLCYHNKYWLVLNKYAEVISNLDYDAIREYYGNDIASTYENTFLDELLQLVGDDDSRVREHTADCLCRFIIQISGYYSRRRTTEMAERTLSTTTAPTTAAGPTATAGRGMVTSSSIELYRTNFNLLWDFYDYRFFQSMSIPIRDLLTEHSRSARLANGEVLAKVLYRLTNKLMELNDRNLQCGIIYALKVLLKAFNFFDFREIWTEFNFVEICFKFAYHNYATALDLNCQNDLMEVTTTLIAGNVLTTNVNSHNSFIDNILTHTMKIINIYYHLFTNQKPLLFAKVQRNDLFSNAKELAIVNSVGYFGSDYVYIKLYNILKAANDSYKMTINQMSGAKLISLLRTCINTLSTCIELRMNCGDPSPSGNPIKLIEEIIQYLTKLINYAPTECIASLRQLLKFLFRRNYGSRCSDYQLHINPYLEAKSIASTDVGMTIATAMAAAAGAAGGSPAGGSPSHFISTSTLDKSLIGTSGNVVGGGTLGAISNHNQIPATTTSSTVVFGQLFATGLELPLWKNDAENECAKHIKLFEPLVIYCLTLFMRSNAKVQASILELLSQLLDLNVTYSILDSKFVIYDEIMKSLDLIESGVARNGNTIIPPVLKFLVQLTYKSDRKIITIPKIISIANNLLANNSIRECSVLALKGLAFEIFLMPAPPPSLSHTIDVLTPHRPAPPPPLPARNASATAASSPLRIASSKTSSRRSSITSVTALDAKELDTQKEVVLGMLEKFIDSQECQRMLAILLLHDRSWNAFVDLQQQQQQFGQKDQHSIAATTASPKPMTPMMSMPILLPSSTLSSATTLSMQEGAIYSIVTKGLCDGKIKVNDWQGFFVLESLFQNSGKNILLDSKEFSSMLALFITKNVESFSDLSCATIILENVILKTEEIYLVNHIKLYLKNHFDRGSSGSGNGSGKVAAVGGAGMTSFELSGYPHLQSMSSSSSGVDDVDYGGRYASSCLPSTSKAAAAAANSSTTSITINEINYFAKVLCEKLDGCLATLAKCRTPPNRKYCGLVVRFVRALYVITEKKDSLQPAVRRLLLGEYNFWERYNLAGLSTDEGLQLEMLKLLLAIKLQSDRNSVLQQLQEGGIKWNVQRTLLKEICLRLEEDLPTTNWDYTEVQQLFSSSFLNILINDNLPFIRILCESNEQFSSLFLRALIENCNVLKKNSIRRVVVQFIEQQQQKQHQHQQQQQQHNLMQGIDAKVELLTKLFDLVNGYGNKSLENLIVRASRRIVAEHDDKLAIRNSFLVSGHTMLGKILFEDELNAETDEAISRRYEQRIIDEKWLFTQIMKSSPSADSERLSRILLEISSEYKLGKMFASPDFDVEKILPSAIDTSLKTMMSSFRNNCIQFNPHIHYMNVNPLAKVALVTLVTHIDNFHNHCSKSNKAHPLPQYLAKSVIALMTNLKQIEELALIYIESKFIDKFVKEHLLRVEVVAALKTFLRISCESIAELSLMNQQKGGALEIFTFTSCIDAILKHKLIWQEFNLSSSSSSMSSDEEELHKSGDGDGAGAEANAQLLNDVLNMLFVVVTQSMGNTIFYKKYKAQLLLPMAMETGTASTTMTMMTSHTHRSVSVFQKAIFLAKLIETKLDVDYDESTKGSQIKCATVPMRILKSIGISILRTNRFYAYAVTPLEIYQQNGGLEGGAGSRSCAAGGGYESQIKSSNGKLPSIPVEHLSDVDVLQKFVKRLSIFGFTTRQQFEEYFMTFLLLINKVYDENMVDVQEQFQIKSVCLEAILELLITYKTFPIVGSKLSYFHHTTRWARINCDSISLKKLHKVQLLVSDSNVFYHPNLERNLSPMADTRDNIIGTLSFQPNQYDLNFIWQQMEAYNSPNSPTRGGGGGNGDGLLSSSESAAAAAASKTSGVSLPADGKEDIFTRNFRHFTDNSGIDFRSSSQLIFDVLMQINEHNHILALPNLVKFCEICDSRDQIKLIRNKALKLQETIPMDDTITHQYVIYLLCKTQAMLIPSPNELSHLCALAAAYLKSSHVFIRNATLSGLLCLLECCFKTNTTMGKLSEELSMLRDLIVGYINRHGIIEESASMQCQSDIHMKLVWALNFSLIEWTSKFVVQCHLLSNTIIWANKHLKRITNQDIYLCVIHGLERIVVINAATPEMRTKIEKLALDLMKLENERFSIPALKLLLTCIYMGSSKQLENTELSNGIVQDDPEIIAQQTDKVDILLHCIKSSTRSAAWIYGQVLCQIIRDLVPPNEILTKVIKEFLAINQPHCDVIASIVHQVFRSAIDSSFLQMLQDWLICSLPTFLALPQQKGVWALTVIFLSASINLHLIKLFPVVLVEFGELGQQEIVLFQTSAQDFHSKLSADQKTRFRDAFKRFQQNEIFAKMLHSL
ncbi:uncharacterized protein LOC129917148 isoform X2 [Episyrphus balteatus]|uniref:uncharacterized protein LOC129917148 isoform X2 n=1 Tax=Episyrphus balteatus TaxID=286459 RepID=UPI00248621FF|nr:uncharacterized protein LOC129917148 isoform X2 [Episyrphus balteatus]